MTNAERQRRYRDRKRKASKPGGVTRVTGNLPEVGASVTEPPENVTNPGPKVTENRVSSEIPRENGISDAVPATPDSGPGPRVASIEDYYANRGDYAERACPELLNWGPWMSASKLSDARLSGNRVILPADWDYVPAGPIAAKESCYL